MISKDRLLMRMNLLKKLSKMNLLLEKHLVVSLQRASLKTIRMNFKICIRRDIRCYRNLEVGSKEGQERMAKEQKISLNPKENQPLDRLKTIQKTQQKEKQTKEIETSLQTMNHKYYNRYTNGRRAMLRRSRDPLYMKKNKRMSLTQSLRIISKIGWHSRR